LFWLLSSATPPTEDGLLILQPLQVLDLGKTTIEPLDLRERGQGHRHGHIIPFLHSLLRVVDPRTKQKAIDSLHGFVEFLEPQPVRVDQTMLVGVPRTLGEVGIHIHIENGVVLVQIDFGTVDRNHHLVDPNCTGFTRPVPPAICVADDRGLGKGENESGFFADECHFLSFLFGSVAATVGGVVFRRDGVDPVNEMVEEADEVQHLLLLVGSQRRICVDHRIQNFPLRLHVTNVARNGDEASVGVVAVDAKLDRSSCHCLVLFV